MKSLKTAIIFSNEKYLSATIKRLKPNDEEHERGQDAEPKKPREQRAGEQKIVKVADDATVDPGDAADSSF